MNKLDPQYQLLLKDIMENGTRKKTRNGETISVFGRTIRHKMSEGFPLLTTKKMYWKGIIAESLWFLRGETNIKFLLDNNCHIWDGDAAKNYITKNGHNWKGAKDPKAAYEFLVKQYVDNIKNSSDFAKQWGELGKIYGFQWRNWNGKTKDELYEDYLKKVQTK
jgi:thymidylate synthase